MWFALVLITVGSKSLSASLGLCWICRLWQTPSIGISLSIVGAKPIDASKKAWIDVTITLDDRALPKISQETIANLECTAQYWSITGQPSTLRSNQYFCDESQAADRGARSTKLNKTILHYRKSQLKHARYSLALVSSHNQYNCLSTYKPFSHNEILIYIFKSLIYAIYLFCNWCGECFE